MLLRHIPRDLRAKHYRLFLSKAVKMNAMEIKLNGMGGTCVVNHLVTCHAAQSALVESGFLACTVLMPFSTLYTGSNDTAFLCIHTAFLIYNV